jgi:bifunctional non-homologous end joining protein LigD
VALQLAGIVDQVPDGTVLDGELVAGGGRGVDFYAVEPSMAARRRRAPLAYVVFDAPHLAGEPILGLPYRDRRRLLDLLDLTGPAWCTVPSFDAEPGHVLEESARLRLEGLVAMRVDSRYAAGKRSAHWRKLICADLRSSTLRCGTTVQDCGLGPDGRRSEPRHCLKPHSVQH